MLRSTRVLRYASANATPPIPWAQTLNLPKTTFPARPAAKDLIKYQKQCTDDLYAWQKVNRPEKNPKGANNVFVLHDGPPYANGALHVGHALNKILKDIILRTYLSRGKRVEYRPGWDCHGLPIELKALQAQAVGKDGQETEDGDRRDSAIELEGARTQPNMTPVEIRLAARELASKAVEEQKESFRSWGVMGDWANPYLTMDKDFELRQLKVFREMVVQGRINRVYHQQNP